jgi:hypothetical protein
VLLQGDGYVELLGRVPQQVPSGVPGYHLQVASSGAWQLYAQEVDQADTVLSSGTVGLDASTWHRVRLEMKGDELLGSVDGKQLCHVTDAGHLSGQVGLRTSPGLNAQFDNVEVIATGPCPTFVPADEVHARASSEAPWNRGYEFGAMNAVDDKPETEWQAAQNQSPGDPDWIVVDLGHRRAVSGLLYQARKGRTALQAISRFGIGLSDDGTNFRTVAEDRWTTGTGARLATWKPSAARFLRITALEAPAGATASDLRVIESR